MKLSEFEPGDQVMIGSGRYEVDGHGPMGSRVRPVVWLEKAQRWGKRAPITVSSTCDAERASLL